MVSELALLPSDRTPRRWNLAAAVYMISRRPWQDVEQGRHRPLAVAELKRLDRRPPAGWGNTGGESEPGRG